MFVAAAAVLVLETLALRLIAPYVGVTLQTNTAVIGAALLAIAVGAWSGGRAADRVADPARLIGPLLLAGAALTLLTLPVVRYVGEATRGTGDASATLLLAMAAVILPAGLLSAVAPMVAKLQLRDLHQTGTIVGKLSGIGTLGGIVATFATGFVLVAAFATSTILIGTAVVVATVGALVLGYERQRTGRPGRRDRAAAGRRGRAAAGRAAAGRGRAEPVPAGDRVPLREGGRRPGPAAAAGRWSSTRCGTRTSTWPTRSTWSSTTPRRSPRWPTRSGRPGRRCRRCTSAAAASRCRATWPRPGRAPAARCWRSTAAWSRSAGEQLGVDAHPRADDPGRRRPHRACRSSRADRFDLVVGDAFGGLAVPWHLTTREVAEQVRDVLTDDGVYAVNVIDYQPDRFARAEAATLRSVFGHVALLGAPVDRGRRGRRQPHPGRRPGSRCRWPTSSARLAERNPWLVADERGDRRVRRPRRGAHRRARPGRPARSPQFSR